MALIQFDASQVVPSEPLTPLADGWYPVLITESDVKPTSTGSGLRMPLTLTVCEGHPYAGRKIFDGLNIQNANPVAQQIAQEQLSAICHAVGVIRVEDSQQLHGIPLLVKVITEGARTDQTTGKTYEAKNAVKGYAKIGSQEVNMTPKKAAGTPASSAPAWAGTTTPAPVAPVAAVAAPAQPTWATQPAAAQAAPVAVPADGPWAQQADGPQGGAAPAATPVAAAAPAAEVPAWARGAQA